MISQRWKGTHALQAQQATLRCKNYLRRLRLHTPYRMMCDQFSRRILIFVKSRLANVSQRLRLTVFLSSLFAFLFLFFFLLHANVDLRIMLIVMHVLLVHTFGGELVFHLLHLRRVSTPSVMVLLQVEAKRDIVFSRAFSAIWKAMSEDCVSVRTRQVAADARAITSSSISDLT